LAVERAGQHIANGRPGRGGRRAGCQTTHDK
jgi:hypothetical protein